MMRVAVAFVLVLVVNAQQPAARVEFEVVSVKLGDPDSPGSSYQMTPVGVQIRNVTLKGLIVGAYQLNKHQVEGGPKWLDSTLFNIDAKLPAGVPRDQIPLMFQSMLADRFRLQFHRQSKMLPQYALVAAKGSPKLQVALQDDSANGSSSTGSRQIKGTGVPISTLTEGLIGAVGAPVLDRTGLKEKYTFVLQFAPLGTLRDDETLPTIFVALQEQLGLKLESVKAPMEVLVIDRAEPPTEN